MSTTKEGIEVAVGQVCRDLDHRMNGRHCLVKELVYSGSSQTEPAALMQVCRPNGTPVTARTTKVLVRRMYKHGTGWALVRKP